MMGEYRSLMSMCYSMLDEVAYRSFFLAHGELGGFFSLGRDRIFGGEWIFFKYRPRIGIFGRHLVRLAISVWKFICGVLQSASYRNYRADFDRNIAVW